MQITRDVIDIVTIEQIPIQGFMFLTICALAYFVYKLQSTIAALRNEHREEIQKINDKHAEKIEELTDRLIKEISKNGIAYQQSANALEMILKANKRDE